MIRFLFGAALLAATAWAQVPSATITGRVVDSKGVAIAKAQVHLKSQDSPFDALRETSADGTFRLAGLSPGNYRLEIGATGFNRYSLPVQLEVRQAIEMEATMMVGELVEVAGITAP